MARLAPRLRITATLVGCNQADILRAAEYLKDGQLVAFPTETVYGLGAHIFRPNALKRIFEVKQRPFNDPLIVHVKDWTAAESIISFDHNDDAHVAQRICRILAEGFWPGPLTIVYRAKHAIPTLITSDTGFIGVRSPVHPIARSLLEACDAPIAAPSANRFGHISPTSAQHVMDDLGDATDLTVIDGGETCEIGVESTVCKIDDVNHAVIILRTGAITRAMIDSTLRNADIDWPVMMPSKGIGGIGGGSPGRFIRHYSPDVRTFLVHPSDIVSLYNNNNSRIALSETAVVDFGGKLHELCNKVRIYHDLSPQSDPKQAAANLFRVLRQIEAQQQQQHQEASNRTILLVDLADDAVHDERLAVLADRMTRAASGQTIAHTQSKEQERITKKITNMH